MFTCNILNTILYIMLNEGAIDVVKLESAARVNAQSGKRINLLLDEYDGVNRKVEDGTLRESVGRIQRESAMLDLFGYLPPEVQAIILEPGPITYYREGVTDTGNLVSWDRNTIAAHANSLISPNSQQ